ncbi:MAG: hypothetical protein Q7P63_02995 [Verrucomicrobiota bacterium JB022]|nr:hypothetical protein [Verrucomicrobiota bacterium JB022]
MPIRGDASQLLIERESSTEIQLARYIGLTGTSLSCLLAGASESRQRLCALLQDEQPTLFAVTIGQELTSKKPYTAYRPKSQEQLLTQSADRATSGWIAERMHRFGLLFSRFSKSQA